LANLHSASKEQGLIQIITPGDIGITAEIAKNFKRRICLTKIDPGVASGIFEIGAYKSDVHNAANGLCDEVIEYHSEFYTNSLQSLIDSAIKAISSFTQSFYKERPLIPTVVSYTEIARLLYNSGLNHAFGDEFSPYHKKVIGDFYQNNYQSDIVVITHHPSSSKNVFNHTSDDWVSDSFEILFNGWDVVQGGIREVDRQSLTLTMEDLDMKADDLCLEYIKRSCEIPEHGGFWLNVSRILASCLGEINVDIVWG
jgi:aspartyl/asparaginyl-tRNA synthetase